MRRLLTSNLRTLSVKRYSGDDTEKVTFWENNSMSDWCRRLKRNGTTVNPFRTHLCTSSSKERLFKNFLLMPKPTPRRENESILPDSTSPKDVRIGFIRQEVDEMTHLIRQGWYDIVVKDVANNGPILENIGEYNALNQNMYLDYSRYMALKNQGVGVGMNFATRFCVGLYCKILFLSGWEQYCHAYGASGSKVYYFHYKMTNWDPDKLRGNFPSYITENPPGSGLNFHEDLYAQVAVDNELHLNLTDDGF